MKARSHLRAIADEGMKVKEYHNLDQREATQRKEGAGEYLRPRLYIRQLFSHWYAILSPDSSVSFSYMLGEMQFRMSVNFVYPVAHAAT